ncbi:MAG: 50S ribosomal protein L13 [Candidatus Woesebacteria bacterium GW2011_GWA1_45_8]|uniref:Large ribosomal subunit protein uL13 n=1 Tax=Candidatus Woesebacteria bacterium GW2011_GWA1_45_8 TaxID=1618559 RepID=A0A0G1MVI8_9BACT|nr:MAG: 50S ribosomal protein L13 [Candidatus Woesebacteria bacterium GW2011_GWA1_45_8]
MNDKTYQPKVKEIKRAWHLIDAKGEVLGRLATRVATLLIGKHKADYSAHLDSGDFVVIINAGNIVLTGKKASQKKYFSHSGYPGGFKEVSFEKLFSQNPSRVIELAVWGMLPDNRLKKVRMQRLKVFKADEHSYQDKFKEPENAKN